VGVKQWVQNSVKKYNLEQNGLPDSSQLPIDVLWQRTLDTMEDIGAHLRRIPYENGDQVLSKEEERTRKTVVILGSGWAAHALMKVADCRKLRLIVVSPSNHFVFTPMLASSAVGTVEYRSMTESVRSANPMIDDYLEGKAMAINVPDQTVTVQLNSLLDGVREGRPPTMELAYDHLIVSVGCRVDDKGVPGAQKASRLKSIDDAIHLRKSIGECFEYASRPDVAGPEHTEERTRRATFLIVGGGATGVELAGELLDLAQDITRPHKGAYPKLQGNVRVVVAHSGAELVPQFDENLRPEALHSLEKKGAEVILNTRVTEVGDGFAKLSTKMIDEETGEVTGRDEFTLPTGLTVWCAGTAPVPLVDQLLQQLPESVRNYDGRIKVDKWMRPAMPKKELLGSILVLGDAAAFPESDQQISDNSLLPQTAQVAGQQGAYAARILSRGYYLTSDRPVLPSGTEDFSDNVFNDLAMARWLEVRGLATAPQFVFLNLGLLAYLGGGEALSQVQVGDFTLFSYFGSVAFVLWRSVYLVKQVATRNRVLVTFDWIKSAIFGRDMTRF
jgi:NADH dehydrogenase FAD-containing subunit